MATLREIRVEKDLSQQFVAERAGVSPKTLSNLETGKRVRRSVVQRVCAVLGVDPSEVTGINFYSPIQHRGYKR